jgi:endonuclease G
MQLLSWAAIAILLLAGCVSPVPEREVQLSPPKNVLAQITAQAPKERLLHLDHKYFEVFYSPEYRLAKYVRYTLTAEQLRARRFKRSDRFRTDDQLAALGQPTVQVKDYRKSGFDKGHLAPADDFAWSQEAMDETFVLTNIVPQKPALNRGLWKALENQVRRWACGEEKITVFTGPILAAGLKTTKSGIPIPKEFFKLIVDETPPRKHAVYILRQNDKGDLLARRLVTLIELQQKLHETILFDANHEESRRPAQVNDWVEKDCDSSLGSH